MVRLGRTGVTLRQRGESDLLGEDQCVR